MLIGQYQHNIDQKGRIIVPSKFREDLGLVFYVTKGLDGCIFVLSSNEWKALEEKIKNMPISKSRAIQRFFFSGAAEVSTDKQGRILIPQHLREYAGLEKDITFIGASSRAEIWDFDRWNKAREKLNDNEIEKVMDELEI